MQREQRPYFEDIEHWEGIATTDGRVSHLRLEANRLLHKIPPSLWVGLDR